MSQCIDEYEGLGLLVVMEDWYIMYVYVYVSVMRCGKSIFKCMCR